MIISGSTPVRRFAGVMCAGLTALMVTSCGATLHSSDSSAGSSAEYAVPDAVEDGGFSEETGRAEDGAVEQEGGASGIDSDVVISDRELIHTAALTVRVDDVPEASERAKELTLAADGYVSSESLSTPKGGTPEAYLTLRIPHDDYEGALEELADLGDRSDLDRSVQDVTEEVADVESRIESSETALETLRGYLEEAENVDDLLRVEREVQDRQAELEALQARRKTLENEISYSTVHLVLMPPQTYIEEPSEESIGFLGGLERGWLALVSVFEGFAVALGWLLPFLAVLAVPVTALAWWLRSRVRRRRAAAPAPHPYPGVPVHTGAGGPGTAGADGTPAPEGGAVTPGREGTTEAAGTGEASEDGRDTDTDGPTAAER
ncbi:DUF4349 domain-containing protein [Nocardiopsis lambiniae]|uniref:DUF4349 domain-containing protein n=1 Tax=Nocardiopsis lambiniae TaxID=3075539 RepID=A0ABU2MAE6_9ACTN|nr:DUF4349 domain-containing protein [Nocardiopsis sp. DSM 44743]MDT0329560.1 DUF4349 domain-containing protein [Nocardiopsis sp. DSM 44743]